MKLKILFFVTLAFLISLIVYKKTTYFYKPITQGGYFNIYPSTHFSPERGVICVSTGFDINDAPTGNCFNQMGPSPFLTQKHISLPAARFMSANIKSFVFSEKGAFMIDEDIECSSYKKTCIKKESNKFLPRLTKAVYGFPVTYKNIIDEESGTRALNAENYIWQDTELLKVEKEENLADLANKLQKAYGSKVMVSKNYQEIVKIYKKQSSKNKRYISLTMLNLKNSSIKSKQLILETEISEDDQALVKGIGLRYQCRRSKKKDWTNKQCPKI